MTPPELDQADALVRAGAWIFPRRTWLPLPFCAALLLVPAPAHPDARVLVAGAAVIALGETLRLLAVREIGVVSRTRSDQHGALVETGPFARVRNPLYLGSIALWVGVSLCAGPPWLALAALVLFGFEYTAIVRWEEHMLSTRLRDVYQAYRAAVPRWLPAVRRHRASTPHEPHPWSHAIFSERGTLTAIATALLLLWLKTLL